MKLFPDIGCGPAAYYHLLFWEDEELDFLQGTKAYNVAYDARDTVRGNYIRLLRDVFLEHPDVFPMYDYTLRLYQWAIGKYPPYIQQHFIINITHISNYLVSWNDFYLEYWGGDMPYSSDM